MFHFMLNSLPWSINIMISDFQANLVLSNKRELVYHTFFKNILNSSLLNKDKYNKSKISHKIFST